MVRTLSLVRGPTDYDRSVYSIQHSVVSLLVMCDGWSRAAGEFWCCARHKYDYYDEFGQWTYVVPKGGRHG